MVRRGEMMLPMLEACPSFIPAWKQFESEWKAEPELPLYLALSDLARHLIAMLERGDTGTFPAIFTVVERWHCEGDPYVQEAATVGLLEDMQNPGLHNHTKPAQFRAYLQPVSLKWWDKLIGFWERGERLKD